MKPALILAACFLCAHMTRAADAKPAAKDTNSTPRVIEVDEMTTQQLRQLVRQNLEDINNSGRANFQSACINVARDVQRKDLLIYNFESTRSYSIQTNGFVIRVVGDPDIVRTHTKWAGNYPNHHNGVVLSFAAAQFASGDKQLSLTVIETLLKLDHEMEWSSPERNIPVHEILKGLQAGGKGAVMTAYLKSAQENWVWRSQLYKQP